MNSTFLITNIMFPHSEKINNWYFSGSYSKHGTHLFFFSKTLYEIEKSEQEYFEEFIKNPTQFLKNRKGDFIIWDYDIENDKLFFATDRMGKDNVYYYQNQGITLLTNDFWSGAALLPAHGDIINWLAVKELIIHYIIPFHKTIINDYNILPPATYGIISKSTEYKIELLQYWEMKFSPRETSMQETIDRIYQLFDGTFQLLARKYGTETKFGVGLSGGWDSRLIVYFAQKYKLKLVPYCIGEKYLWGPITTNGYRVSKKIAKYFGLNNFTFIEYSKESYLKKAAREVELTPNKASNIEIGCLESVPDFDIMLNGEHGGVFFGEFDFEDILNYTSSNMEECLLNLLATSQNIDMIMSKDDQQALKQDTTDYMAGLNTDKRWEIYYKYFFEIKGSKTKNGFFETNYGTKKRYTMYLDPDFVDEYLTWDPLFLVNRTMQREFFKKYFKELSRIEDETTDAPLYWRDMSIKNVPRRFMYGIKNYVFKSSLRRAYWIKHDKEFKHLLSVVYEKNKSIIKEHFPKLNIKEFYRTNPRGAANFVKVIMVIDSLLNQKEGRFDYIMNKYSDK